MNIYLASGFRQRTKLRHFASLLEEKRISVCSRWIWLDERPERGTEDWETFAEAIAYENVEDLIKADAIIIDTEGIADSNNGGVHFETGFMYALGKPVIVVGRPKNTFHWLQDIFIVENYNKAMAVVMDLQG